MKRPAAQILTDVPAVKKLRQDTSTPSTRLPPATPKTEDTSETIKATGRTASSAASATSTSTGTGTGNASVSADIYDAMLGEISDLLMAAQQAQTLGRLKMASTYQLLVHARLVGLGKRFDRFLAHGQGSLHKSSSGIGSGRTLSFPQTSSKEATATAATPKSKDANAMRNAQATLAKILPSDVDLDNTMMEHLARAAMELHNKRTGRGMLHEKSEAKKNAGTPEGAGGVAWTDVEKTKCIGAAEKFGREEFEKIAAAVGTRTAAEVKAHLRNLSGREKIEQKLASTGVKKGDSPVGAKGNAKNSGNDTVTPEKVKRGRGKKPPSKAMLTVCTATFDAKKLVSGGL